jgi:hypothetical protein
MAQSLSPRLERLCAIVAAGFWLVGIALLWALARPSPRMLAATMLGSYFLGWGAALVLARPPRSRAIARFTLTTLALALALGGLELSSAVGLVDFRAPFVATGSDPRDSADNVLDPELIHIHRPHLRRAGVTRGDLASAFHLADAPLYPYDVAYDRNGFRNPRELSTAEVVVLGDSFVEGGLVAADDLLTATLGRLLGCTVANLGQSAYGPQQELAVLRRHATPLRPRFCIWVFYEGNDLGDVERYEVLRRGEGRAVGAGRSTPRERSFGRNALGMLARRLGPVLDPGMVERAPWGTFREADGRWTRLFFRDRGGPMPGRELVALDKVVSVLTDADAACAASGSPLLVVFAPQKFRVYKDYCTFRPDNPCARWVLDDLPERLRARVGAIGTGISFLDLTPALAAEAARGRLLYFADDTHWSAEGHRAAGRAIAAHVAGRRDLGLSRMTRGPTPIEPR